MDNGVEQRISELVAELRELLLGACGDDTESPFEAVAQSYSLEQRIRAIGLECARVGRDNLAETTPNPSADRANIDKWAGDQVARKAHLNCGQGHAYVRLAEETRQRLAPAFASLSRGDIDFQKLQVLSSQCFGLTDDIATAVQNRVLAKPPRCGASDFRRRTHRHVLRLDPRTAEQRRISARRCRKVLYFPADDGQATLILQGPAEELRPLKDRITRMAKGTPKDGRDFDQICYDVARDLMYGAISMNSGPEATLNVTVAFETLVGINDEPAKIDGHGPVVAALARELAKNPRTYFRRLTTLDGHLVHITDRYRPTGSQAAYARLRDDTCPWPGCNHPSSSGDLDHGNPYSATGITDTSDLAGWCRRHHLLKTLGFFTWSRTATGAFDIHLHNGITFTTEIDTDTDTEEAPPQPVPVTTPDDEPPPF